MKQLRRYSAEWRERAVRLVREHQTEYPSQKAAIVSFAGKLGCSTKALRGWVRKAEQEAKRARLTAYERRRLKELERENRELRSTNDLLRKAYAFFAHAALDRAPVEGDRRRRRSTAAPTEGEPQPDASDGPEPVT